MKTRSKLIAGIVIVFGVILVILFQGTHHSKTNKQVGEQKKVRQTNKNSLPGGAKPSDWQLILVNKQHSHTSEISFNKATVDGVQLDKRIEKPLANFRDGAQKAGYTTTLVSGYRSIQYQTQVYNNSLAQNEANGMNENDAKNLTQSVIQTPGSSEHQTGLAVDLAGKDALAKYPALMAQMDEFESQKWLIKHAPDYGFILRYLASPIARSQTGIDYESWHFRYVGKANAKYITKHHLTLEAYIDELQKADKN